MSVFVSDETLHAYVDGELEVPECEALLVRIQDDPELARRVCELRSLRDMVKLAYAEPPLSAGMAVSQPRRAKAQRCAMGCLALFAGLAMGWGLRGLESGAAVTATSFESPLGLQAVSLARAPDPNRVMFHLDNADAGRMLALLDEAERLLEAARREGRQMQVEVVANSHGLNLLRANYSPYAERIARLHQQHANLKWVACGQSIARFRGEGQTVELLPAVSTTPAAIGEIVTRLQQGWTYVHI